jgi:hypothetical protein
MKEDFFFALFLLKLQLITEQTENLKNFPIKKKEGESNKENFQGQCSVFSVEISRVLKRAIAKV